MVAKLTVTPNPAPAGSVVAVTGTGFVQSRLTRVLLDGVVQATDFRSPKGAFAVGILVSKTAKPQTVEVEQKQPGGSWSVVARLAPLLTFLPPSGADVTAPIITATAQAINITSTSFTVSWTTNEPSTSVVNYGTTGAYGSTTTQTPLVTTHAVPITGLTASTLYHFRVQSVDAAGNTVVSGDATQTTFAGGVTDTTPPVISSIVATPNINGTQCTISWSLDEYATGQVFYGLTSALGQASVKETSFAYNAHVQTLSSLTPNTLYYYKVQSIDASGNTATSSIATFTTASTTVPTMYLTNVYGPAVSTEGKNNYQVGWTNNARVAIRFIASQASAPSSIAVNIRGGTTYSGGGGGTITATVEADASGVPSGSALATVTWNPGNPGGNWESKAVHSFSGSPTALVIGQTYWIVFTNTHASPTTNWVSVNHNYDSKYWGLPTNRLPAFSDVLSAWNNQGVGWDQTEADIPAFDLAYANGQHDGQAYFGGLFDSGGALPMTTITGLLQMARARFTVSGGNRTVSTMGVNLYRISGSNPVTFTLENSGGTTLATGTVASGNWPTTALADFADTIYDGSRWGVVTFTPLTLTNGSTYRLRVSCPSTSTYMAAPMTAIDAFDADPDWGSKFFHDGIASSGGSMEYTTDGSTWNPPYAFEANDLQFYLL